MRVRLNRIAHPVTTLGPGRRMAVWVQGCTIGCQGCASQDTWDAAGGAALLTAELADELAPVVVREDLTGLTLTGGEPTEQPDAVADLVRKLRQRLADGGRRTELDVLLFTGRTARAAARVAPALWNSVDAAIAGPYRRDRPGTHPLVASTNQELVLLSPLGESRFAAVPGSRGPSAQAHVGHGDITLVGLPRPGDLTRIESALRERGVSLEGRSWTS